MMEVFLTESDAPVLVGLGDDVEDEDVAADC